MTAEQAFMSLVYHQTTWVFYKNSPDIFSNPRQPRDLEPEKKVSFPLLLQDDIMGDVPNIR
jgi:hypothetical protein